MGAKESGGSLLWEQIHWGSGTGTAHTDGGMCASFRNVAACMGCLPVSFQVSCPKVTNPGAQTRLTASVTQFIINVEHPSRKQGQGGVQSESCSAWILGCALFCCLSEQLGFRATFVVAS